MWYLLYPAKLESNNAKFEKPKPVNPISEEIIIPKNRREIA